MTAEAQDPVPAAPRRRWWLWLPLGCLGFVAAIFLLGALVVSGRARSRWKEFQGKHSQLAARVTSRPAEREPLEPPSTPGNAWEAWSAAASRITAIPAAERSAIDDFLAGKAAGEVEKRALAALDAHASDLEALRAAAHVGAYQDGLRWEDGWAAELAWLAPDRQAARVLAASARRRRLAGDLTGAVDEVATMLQMGLDAGSTGPVVCFLVGGAILRMAALQAADLLAEPGLDAARAARLERLFTLADARLRPLDEVLEADSYLLNTTLVALAEGRGPAGDIGLPSGARLLAWRHGFSWRIVAADVHDLCENMTRRSRELSVAPWSEAWPGYQEMEAKIADDPFLGLLFTACGSVDRGTRSTRARLRLVAAGAHERATGAPPEAAPVDPFTMRPLHRREDPGGATWWSEWLDGDQGGTGSFVDDPSGTPADIVLPVKRGR